VTRQPPDDQPQREVLERIQALEDGMAGFSRRFNQDPMLSSVDAGVMAILLPRYTVATLPATPAEGQMAYATDETGGAVPVFADSAGAWRRVTDRVVAS
jgi:hypothetical protein